VTFKENADLRAIIDPAGLQYQLFDSTKDTPTFLQSSIRASEYVQFYTGDLPSQYQVVNTTPITGTPAEQNRFRENITLQFDARAAFIQSST
jgi:hypothetical protein